MFWKSVSYNVVGDVVHIDGSMNQSQYLKTLNDFTFLSGESLIGEVFIRPTDLNIIENVGSLIK